MSTALLRLRRHATPPSPLAGRLATQSLLFALGDGTFLAGSAVFFTQVVGLTAVEVGLGLTIAGVVGFLAAYPMGKLVDRIGPGGRGRSVRSGRPRRSRCGPSSRASAGTSRWRS